MITVAGAATLAGLGHQLNEDRYRLLGSDVPVVRAACRGQLFAVFDGVSTAPDGRRAAQLVADRLVEFYSDSKVPPTSAGLGRLLVAASAEIVGWGFVAGTQVPKGAAAGTVAWFAPDQRVVIFQCGDTVAYRCTGKAIARLTEEHGDSRGLRRYFGQGSDFEIDELSVALDEGDAVVLASDGVTRVLDEAEIAEIVGTARDPDAAARAIVSRARAKGSADDITAVVVELEEW